MASTKINVFGIAQPPSSRVHWFILMFSYKFIPPKEFFHFSRAMFSMFLWVEDGLKMG